MMSTKRHPQAVSRNDTEKNGKQHPIRYVSKVLHDAEKNYAPLEKLALALRNASRRLRRYFEAHPITVKAVLADFLNEILVGDNALVPRETTYTKEDQKDRQEEWMLFTDGASSSKGSGAGLVLISPTKKEYTYALRLTLITFGGWGGRESKGQGTVGFESLKDFAQLGFLDIGARVSVVKFEALSPAFCE
ncbi:reverse transcriptase domain-containing protein [Tanacetum coccineum]